MLYRNTLLFMHRLQQTAARGNYYYTSGEISLSRFEQLANKFAKVYGTELSRKAKYKRRRTGEATATLYAVRRSTILNENGEIPVCWVLIVSGGAGRIRDREQLYDLRNRDSRLTFANKYELVHDGKTWSWQISSSAMQKYKEQIHRIAALPIERRQIIEIDGVRCDKHAEQLQDRLYSEPGFRLVRRQVGHLVSQLRKEWARVRPEKGPKLIIRRYLPIVRFMPDQLKEDTPTYIPDVTMSERRALFLMAFPDQNDQGT
ncbi:hypothetical protein [Chromobacterium violaceum]|uniref:hypothetical protein n=1 Tax=Chromobacterium violaceum TaxID=536 RepID=UPI0012D2A4A4|nr:hypothetical protein [Chromobacterium violaceum]